MASVHSLGSLVLNACVGVFLQCITFLSIVPMLMLVCSKPEARAIVLSSLTEGEEEEEEEEEEE